MRILVTGAQGMLAHALLPCLQTEHEVVGVDVGDFDITQGAGVQRAFREVRPELVFHLAAYTDVDGCEANPERADAVNAQGTHNVARACADWGARLLYVSTDYVFDGRGNRPYRGEDPPNPLSVYGRSKLRGEQHVQALLARHFIVRSAWLYGPGGKNFVATIRRLAAERDEIRVVNDQHGSPTYTRHLARKLAQFSATPDYGIYHVTGAGSCSWFEFARAILDSPCPQPCRVVGVSTEEFGRPARRPAYSVLDNHRLVAGHLGLLPDWREGLAEYLQEGQRLGEFAAPTPRPEKSSLQGEGIRT